MYLHQSRKTTHGSNFAIATSYLIFAFALVSFVFAAAIPGPGTLRSQRRNLLYSISHIDDSLHYELASRGTAHSSTSNLPEIKKHNAFATTKITGKNVAIIHFPNPTPLYPSEDIQKNVMKAIGVLLKAVFKELGTNPPGDARRSFQVYGYIGKMDLKTFQYEFVVQIFSGDNKLTGGSAEEWIECKGRVGFTYDNGKMVVSGRVVDPEGKPIVTLNPEGLLVAKPDPLPEESSGDSHKPTKMGGKKVQWADPLESHHT
ncbi:hypothetical protein F5051DRAFT_428297 [Lentinula edodes]|nr:hypothetical protein F5051DRAFT_428297 [Lentinula edodes]